MSLIATEESFENTEEIHHDVEGGNLPVVGQLLVALSILGIVFASTYTGTLAALMKKTEPPADIRVEATITESALAPGLTSYFDDMSLTARAAFVWDVKNERVLFNKNADEALPLASVTKLMTALVAYELLDDNSEVDISVEAIREDGDSGFHDGEIFSVRDLTDLMLIESSNDGARALSSAAGSALVESNDPNQVFIEAMNIKAGEIGLSSTHFKNVTGLDISKTEPGAVGTARDMAFLMEYIITHYPDVVALTSSERTTIDNADGEYHIVKNTNEAVNDIKGLIASKTGYTELAGGNLVIAFNAGFNRPIIVSVLSSTQNGRFEDAKLLSERARAYVLSGQ